MDGGGGGGMGGKPCAKCDKDKQDGDGQGDPLLSQGVSRPPEDDAQDPGSTGLGLPGQAGIADPSDHAGLVDPNQSARQLQGNDFNRSPARSPADSQISDPSANTPANTPGSTVLPALGG